jgi:hypothetical protein
MQCENLNGPQLKAKLVVQSSDEMYKIVDFLNKNLKANNIIFGLTQCDDKMTMKIYET